MARSFIELSRIPYGLADHLNPTPEQIQAGCLQRIAASMEKLEQPYMDLDVDRNYYKAMTKERDEIIKELRLSVSSYKGHITRLRKQIEKLQGNKDATA